jgi:cyclic pyranopterin phosphate synthase
MDSRTTAIKSGEATGTGLVDGFGRVHDYARIAVNERCNLRCIYCMPAEGLPFREGPALLTRDELLRVIRILSRLGVTKIRFTGGEPLLRKDLTSLVEGAVSEPGIESVHLTTNGFLLADNARALLDAGLTGVNVSLDTLDAAKFLTITRREGVERVLGAIRTAVRVGFPSVKVNVVALRGFNDDEIAGFAALTRDDPITVRFIELMPFDSDQVWKRGHFFSADWIVATLRRTFPGLEDASGTKTEHHVFRLPGHAGKVAVIPAYTRSLCSTCSRIRVTADGKVRNCLYSTREFELKRLLRSGRTDEEVARLFRAAVRAKLESGWDAQKRPESGDNHDPRASSGGRDSMTLIGG